MFIFLYVFGPLILLFKRNYVAVVFLAAVSCEAALVLNEDPVGVDNIFFG